MKIKINITYQVKKVKDKINIQLCYNQFIIQIVYDKIYYKIIQDI